MRVWYDREGEDLTEALADVYANQARFVMVFLSEHYTDRDWTTFELEVARTAAKSRATAYLIHGVISTEVPAIVDEVV